MGLSCASAEMIIQEHLYRPITGKVLLIGRQNTDITPTAWLNLLDLYGLKPKRPIVLEKRGSLDHKTITLADETDRIADVTVFQSIADCKVMALDISDYEGAEVVHDLNRPLPWWSRYRGKFDFIFDGSSLDNIFNVTQALFTMSQMLKPGGRLMLYNTSNSHPTAYLQFSPDWIWDYFAANGYADCKVYIHEFPLQGEFTHVGNPETPIQNGCLWHFDPLVVYNGQYGFQNSHIADRGMRFFHAIAEKGLLSTSKKSPVQMHYRGGTMPVYVKAARRFRDSKRPIFRPKSAAPFDVPSIGLFENVYPIARWTERKYPPQQHVGPKNESPAFSSSTERAAE